MDGRASVRDAGAVADVRSGRSGRPRSTDRANARQDAGQPAGERYRGAPAACDHPVRPDAGAVNAVGPTPSNGSSAGHSDPPRTGPVRAADRSPPGGVRPARQRRTSGRQRQCRTRSRQPQRRAGGRRRSSGASRRQRTGAVLSGRDGALSGRDGVGLPAAVRAVWWSSRVEQRLCAAGPRVGDRAVACMFRRHHRRR